MMHLCQGDVGMFVVGNRKDIRREALKMSKNPLCSRCREEGGYSLVLVIVAITVVIFLCYTAVSYASGLSKASTMNSNNMQAYYAADAGIVQAQHYIVQNSSSFTPTAGQVDFGLNTLKWSTYNGNGSLQYGKGRILSLYSNYTAGASTFTLTSKSEYPDPTQYPNYPNYSLKTITATFSIPGSGSGSNPGGGATPGGGNLASGDGSLFTYGILTKDFDLESNAVMSGVACTDSLTMSGGGTIGGSSAPYNVYSNGGVTVSNGSGLNGGVYAQGNVSLTGGSNVMNSVQALGTLYIGGGTTVSGTIEAHGSAELAGTFPQAQSDSSIKLDGGTVINGPVNAGGSLELDNGTVINGNPQTMGSLNFVGGGCQINGTAYVNGSTSPVYPSNQYTISGGVPKYLASLPSLNLNIPTVPSISQPNLAYYSGEAQAQGNYYSSGQTIKLDTQTWKGVYYYNGNITVSSSEPWDQTDPNFSGQAVIVASGKITFDGNQCVLPKTAQDSLVLISGGDMDLQSNNHSANNTLYLYSGGNMNLTNNPLGQGALVCAGTLSIGGGSGNQFTQVTVNSGGGGSVGQIVGWQQS
jgi:type II secretory pathway pseudopilin PulG